MDEFTLTLNSPITEEQWDTIADVDFDHTNEITFHTKHGKQVVFVKRMRGRWECSDDFYETGICSCCEWDSGEPLSYAITMFKYCPHCGSYNGGEQE